jgi:RecA-family ATPase
MIRVAAGQPWDGRLVEQARGLYVAAESPESIRTRILAHRRQDGLEALPIDVVKERINLKEPASRSEFRKKLVAYKNAHPDLAFVIVDTFRAATPGADENAAEAMGPVISDLHDAAMRLDIHIMVIHHTTKAGQTYSGSGVLGAVVDTEIMIVDETDLEEDGNRGCLVGKVVQQRGLASKLDEFFYRIEGIETGRTTNFGKPETAPVVESITAFDLETERLAREAEEEEEEAAQADEDADRVLQAILADPGHRTGRTFLIGATGLPEARINAAKDLLVSRGVLTRIGEGSGTRYVLGQGRSV